MASYGTPELQGEQRYQELIDSARCGYTDSANLTDLPLQRVKRCALITSYLPESVLKCTKGIHVTASEQKCLDKSLLVVTKYRRWRKQPKASLPEGHHDGDRRPAPTHDISSRVSAFL